MSSKNVEAFIDIYFINKLDKSKLMHQFQDFMTHWMLKVIHEKYKN